MNTSSPRALPARVSLFFKQISNHPTTMALGNVALLFFFFVIAPNRTGAVSPIWTLPVADNIVGRSASAGGNVSIAGVWPPPTEIISRASDSREAKAAECGARCSAAGVDCTDPGHPCSGIIGSARSSTSATITPSVDHRLDYYGASSCDSSWIR